MGQKEDFKNFFIIKRIEEDTNNKTLLEAIFNNKLRISLFIVFIVFLILIYKIFFSPINLTGLKDPNGFFQINNGESVNYIANELEKEKIIKSALIFKLYMKMSLGKDVAQAGIYKFTQNDSLVSVVRKIKNAEFAVSPVRVTIPEGSTNEEVAEIIARAFSNNPTALKGGENFSTENILSYMQDMQGYLFPETYFFLPNTSISQIITELRNKSYENLKDLFTQIKIKTENDSNSRLKIYSVDLKEIDLTSFFDDSTKSINQNKKLTIINDLGTTTLSIKNLLIMASYLEGEANNEKDMKLVAGVLWTRLKIGYFLQIDAATSTYKTKGFTKNSINNPGLVAIESAINPTKTEYLYYLTGNDGQTYYTKTYEGHLVNIKKYLR